MNCKATARTFGKRRDNQGSMRVSQELLNSFAKPDSFASYSMFSDTQQIMQAGLREVK